MRVRGAVTRAGATVPPLARLGASTRRSPRRVAPSGAGHGRIQHSRDCVSVHAHRGADRDRGQEEGGADERRDVAHTQRGVDERVGGGGQPAAVGEEGRGAQAGAAGRVVPDPSGQPQIEPEVGRVRDEEEQDVVYSPNEKAPARLPSAEVRRETPSTASAPLGAPAPSILGGCPPTVGCAAPASSSTVTPISSSEALAAAESWSNMDASFDPEASRWSRVPLATTTPPSRSSMESKDLRCPPCETLTKAARRGGGPPGGESQPCLTYLCSVSSSTWGVEGVR
eukprot:scaffold5952_cov91-Isochrysis_galbana.AAC.3